MTSTLDPAEIPEYPMTRAAGCPFDPPPGLKTAQQAGPLAKVRLEDGRTFWLVTRYADQRAVLASSKVSSDLRRFAFNTAIAAVMELLNDCYRLRSSVAQHTLRFALASAGSLVFPFAPHLGAEVYEHLTGARVWEQPWPQADERLLESDVYELVCQVNGKLRDRVRASAGASEEELKQLCRVAPNVRAHVDGREIVKEIVVPGKLVNLVVR